MSYTMELACCEMVLLGHISKTELKQKDIAQTYAMAIVSSEAKTMNWAKVNDAIAARWSRAAVERVKKEAWRIIEHHQQQHRQSHSESTP